jgi:hypothetical protein
MKPKTESWRIPPAVKGHMEQERATEQSAQREGGQKRRALIGVDIQKEIVSRAPVSHTYNPSYSGGRDQEDHGSKPACANSLRDPISKNTLTKKGGV